MTAATTPWARGRLDVLRGRPKLLFGQMYEDVDVELSVFPRRGRVFTIASAGTTSMALAARGLDVTAVDINPAQVDYVRQRLGGAPMRMGTADRLFAFGRSLFPLMGLWPSRVRAFLELEDPKVQMAYWRRHLDTSGFRLALRLLINPVALQLVYHRTFLKVVPARFDRVMRRRLERCFARHPNRTNPYAWRLFAGSDPPGEERILPAPEPIELVEADAAAYLERCPPRSFDGFSLSNILDGTDAAYLEKLMAAVRHTARPRATMVLRSFADPPPGESMEWALKDRSMLWGLVRVERVGD